MDTPALTPQIVDELMSTAEVSPIADQNTWCAFFPWSAEVSAVSHSASSALALLHRFIPRYWDRFYPELRKFASA